MKPATILIADDNAGMLTAIGVRLEQCGYNVLRATDAYHAFNHAVRERPDLLILDIHMPAGEGFSVIERINGIQGAKRVPFLFLTGDSDPGLARRADQLGAFALLRKPFATRELLGIIERALKPLPAAFAA